MDEGRVSYEEAVEAIRNWIKAVYEFSDDDVETIYANGRPIDMVREQTRNALTIYDLEYGYRGPVGNFTSIDDVAWLLANCDICVVACLMMLVGCAVLCSCSEADKVNRNISKQTNYFEAERRITVYNARTDNVILEMEGAMSISNNDNNELVCTVKTGPNEYKKNYIYLNEYTMYVVEDITGTHTDPYHYQLYFHTDILPDMEVRS